MESSYIHGYHPDENARLCDQAFTLAELLHSDTSFLPGSLVLEAGCGVGAQTVTLAANSPDARIISFDLSGVSVAEAAARTAGEGLTHVRFIRADLFQPPFADESFDHIFVCFVLEHIPKPVDALRTLKRLIRPGGTVTVIEGDHGSAYFHPDSKYARAAIQSQVELQARAGGNANLGRELYPLLLEAGFDSVRVSPRMVYADSSRPQMVDGFTSRVLKNPVF